MPIIKVTKVVYDGKTQTRSLGDTVLINTDKIIRCVRVKASNDINMAFTSIDLTHAMVVTVDCVENIEEIYNLANPNL